MKIFKITATLILGLFVSKTFAADLYCQGIPTAVLTYSDGRVTLNSPWRQDWTDICNLNTGGQVCKTYMATIQNAIATGKTIVVSYINVAYTCDTLPTYNVAPAPTYVAIWK